MLRRATGDAVTAGLHWDEAGSPTRLAIRQWIVLGAAPEIAASRVIWSGQQGEIPDGMYITIALAAIGDMDGLDGSFLSVNVDASYTETVGGPRRVKLEVVCFGSITQKDATQPIRIIERIKTRLRLNETREAFQAANVGVWSVSMATAPGRGIDSVVFEPRGMFSVELALQSEVTGTVSVIETVNTSGTYH